MFLYSVLFVVLQLSNYAAAQVVQLLTAVDEGHNIIAKLPCVGCPLLVQDKNGKWIETQEDNALLLHISLPFDSTSLAINNAHLLTPSKILPRIRAAQVPLDSPPPTIAQLNNPDSLSFGLSYSYSLHHVTESPALVFRFNVIDLWTDATPSPLTVKLDKTAQRVVQVVLLRRPIMGAGDPSPLYEIAHAEIVPRDGSKRSPRTMHWGEWDHHGRKGTPEHLLTKTVEGVGEWVGSTVLGLCVFVVAVMGLFVVLSLFCIFGWGFWKGEYQQAQSGKGSPRRTGKWGANDVERAKGRFQSPHELGLRTGGTVVGVGKSD